MKKLCDSALGRQLRNLEALKAMAFQFAYWFCSILFLESMLRYSLGGTFGPRGIYVVLFSTVAAGLLTVTVSFLPRRFQFPIMLVLSVVTVFIYGSQVVYKMIFGTLYAVSQMKMGGAAVTSFWKETIATIWENLGFILLLALPVPVLIGMRICGKKYFSRGNMLYRILLLTAMVTVHVLAMQHMTNKGTGYFTDYYYYHAKDATTTQTAERFGLITAFRLELFGTKAPEASKPVATEPAQLPELKETEGQTMEPVEETKPVEYNVLDIDFDALNAKTEDETIRAVNDYVATLTGTKKNEYTGMLHDYNLIVLCAESFSTAAIHKDLTPTLYRLANEGIVFENYYNAFPNNTTDGEYALLTGLNPDGSRDKVNPSFYAARGSYLPFTLGMIFKEQAGIQSYGYHNHTGDYYARNQTHPNIGYQMKFSRAGMTFTSEWPTSDLEMMEQSVDDYIGSEQFHAYYMTFSGHYKYDRATHPISKRNWDKVKDLEGCRDTAKCYLSCHIELDRALEYLMQRLEEEGVADRTAIVLAADHYPYGLNINDYSSLLGHPVDDFEKYKSPLIFWVGGLEENIVVEEYCCNVDILPTILNLWGFEYDSRLLAGTDVFSDSLHVAVRVDKSFYTDKMWLNANTGEIKYLVDPSEIPEGYVEQMIRLIEDRQNMSVNILNSAYYNFLFEKGDVKVGRNWWTDWDRFRGPDDEPEEEQPEDGETPNPGEDGETPNPGEGGETPNPGEGGETPNPGEGGETPNPGEGGETPNPGEGGETPNPGGGGETSDQAPAPDAGGETPPPAADTENET